MHKPVRTVAPAETAITLSEAKDHLRIEHSDDDTIIGSIIDAAMDYLDGYRGVLGRAIVTQTWKETFKKFNDTRICLRLEPVNSISSITYYDEDNAQQTLSSAAYSLHTDDGGSYLRLNNGYSWPGLYDRDDAVTITYIAGYGAASDVPDGLKLAIKMLVTHFYENREIVGFNANIRALPFTLNALLAPYLHKEV